MKDKTKLQYLLTAGKHLLIFRTHILFYMGLNIYFSETDGFHIFFLLAQNNFVDTIVVLIIYLQMLVVGQFEIEEFDKFAFFYKMENVLFSCRK